MLMQSRGEPHLTHLGTIFVACVLHSDKNLEIFKRVIPESVNLQGWIVKFYRGKSQFSIHMS
jgi:hypothetical protein